MNVFKRFRHFICIFLCIILIFTFSQFSKPKEVKAIEPVTTLTYATYLLIGGLATLCGIKFASMPSEARYGFISGGFEAIKDVGEFVFDDERGIATKLLVNEATIKAFLKYAQSKEGSSFVLSSNITPINGFYDLPFSVSSTSDVPVIISVVSLKNTNGSTVSFPIYSNGTFTRLNLVLYSRKDVTLNICTQFKPSYGNLYDLYASTTTQYNADYMFTSPTISTGNYILKIPESSVDSVSILDKTVVYPGSLTDVRGIEDYNKIYDKTNVGQQSIEVDGTKTGVDIATPIDNANTFANDIVFPSGIEEGVEVPGLKINAGEGSIEASPDTTKDDTLEHQGILQDILDWIGSLFLSLFKFLLDLLEKLIQLLKELLISLFVPGDSFVKEKVDMLKSQLEPKLPYAQYLKLFSDSYTGNELKDIVIHIFGQDVVIVKVTLFEHFRELFNTGVYAVMFFLLAVYNYNNIYKLIRGTDYVSATNTINNATGGTGGSGKGGGD